jgi:hypothetical protein
MSSVSSQRPRLYNAFIGYVVINGTVVDMDKYFAQARRIENLELPDGLG